MRATQLRFLFRSALSLAAMAVSSFALASGAPEGGFALGGIQEGLRRSPDQYLAAKLEVVGAPNCSDPKNEASCVSDARIVENFASRGGRFRPGDIVSLHGGGSIGSVYLAFTVPAPDQPNVYGATFMSLDVGSRNQELFRADLKRAGL